MPNHTIPYGRQYIDDDDILAVSNALRSANLTQGSYITDFESALADYCGSEYAVVVSSGTAALHLSYMALDLSDNDEIITSPITFAATTNAALYLNATIKFVDINRDTILMDNDKIESVITDRSKIIVPVHFAGLPSDMRRVSDIAKKYNLKIVEDAAHAIGARYYNGKMVGCCDYSDLTVFSFHPIKSITTGEGGAITTNDKALYEKLKLLRSHGIDRSGDYIYDPSSPFYHEMKLLGYNYRMTDIQAALGLSQLKKLDMFISRRNLISNYYRITFLDSNDIRPLSAPDGRYNAYHLCTMILSDETKRDKLIYFLKERGINTQIHYMPVYLHPYYQDLGYGKLSLSVAEDYYRRALSIPIYPAMSNDEVRYIADKIKEFFWRE